MDHTPFTSILAGLTSEFTPVVGAGFAISDYHKIDLSRDNRKIPPEALASAEHFSKYLSEVLRSAGKKVAWGGYNEQRGLYQRSTLFGVDVAPELVRNIHLGIDIWATAGTPVLAPLAGVVHSFRENSGLGDYGPTILLEHPLDKEKIYTLYGHLSRRSLEHLRAGDKIEKGQQIGALGTVCENGDYAPHLHFQVIRDLQGRKGDFPGVAAQNDLEACLKNCPDPNLLLKIPENDEKKGNYSF